MKKKEELKPNKSIRRYLSFVLLGTLVCGLSISGFFSWNFTMLERMQYEVSSQSLTLRELQDLGGKLDLLLVSADLSIGAGETYSAQIAINLSRELRKYLKNMEFDNMFAYEARQFRRLRIIELLSKLEQQIQAQVEFTTVTHDEDRTGLLEQFDAVSAEIVLLFEQIFEATKKHSEQMSSALVARRNNSFGTYAMVLLIYFLANAIIVDWSFRRIAKPLEVVTQRVNRVMSHGKGLLPSLKGPLEISRLAENFFLLVSQLEKKVAERTQALLEKTETLEQEISDRKAAKTELVHAKEIAEKSNKVKSEFLSVMSHELRTPMNSILGALSLIREGGINAQQETYIDIADKSGNELIDLLGEILDISRIGSEVIELKNEDFNIVELVNTCTEMLQSQGQEKGLRISATIDPEVPHFVIGDSSRVRQILTNLIGNAIKFTDRGFVEIQVSAEAIDNGNHVLCFSVTDTGIGIAQADQSRIFEEFTQVDSSLTRRHPGVGLGLSVCNKLAEVMGGRCGVNSKLGAGSNFWFIIDLPTGENPLHVTAGGQSIPANPPTIGNRVLIVEDSESNQLVAHAMLSTAGYKVDVASCGFEALQKFGYKHYDLVLMDLQMPGMDGFETTSVIRSLPGRKGNLPIIAFSANTFEGIRTRCKNAGMNDYIGKPLIKDTLLTKIGRWISLPDKQHKSVLA